MVKKEKNNILVHKFDPVIYPYKIYIALSDNPNEISKSFLDYENGEEFSFMNTEKFGALTLQVMEKTTNYYGVLIIFKSKKYMDIKSICHESSHAAKFLFKHIGADVEEHEPFEYLIGWIAECCDKVKKMKNGHNEQ